MDESNWMSHWARLLGELYVYDRPHTAFPAPPELDAAEVELGIQMPASYRAFVRTFGPGRLAERFTIYAPGYPEAPVVDLLTADGWQPIVSEDRGDPYPRRLVAFGGYRGHHGWFAWDREEVTDPRGPEYRIVFVPRWYDEPIIVVAESFPAWVEGAVLGLDFYRRYGVRVSRDMVEWEDEETGERRTYKSFAPIG